MSNKPKKVQVTFLIATSLPGACRAGRMSDLNPCPRESTLENDGWRPLGGPHEEILARKSSPKNKTQENSLQ